MKVSRSLLMLALTAPLAACGSTPDPVLDDAGTQPDAPAIGDHDAASPETRDAGPSGDSFDSARPVAANSTVSDAIATPGNVDYWRFEGTAGQWIAISTTANADDEIDMIDTVITLFDSTRTQIAENDDAQPRVSTDSEILIRLPSTGVFYVTVQDFSSWITDDDIDNEGEADFVYELAIGELNTGSTAITVDAEPGDDAATAGTLAFGGTSNNVAFLFGTFNDATDVDVFSFTVPGTEPRALTGYLMPVGADGYGSTRAPLRAWVTNADDTEIIARIEPRAGQQFEISPPVAGGAQYRLWIDAGGGTAGANDHYVFKAFLSTENTPEAETTPNSNDTTATATAVTLTTTEGANRAFILSTLASGDVDIYSFPVTAGQQVSAYCGAQSSGSGVRGLSAAIISEDGTVLAMGTETAIDGASVPGVAPSPAGTYYLRLQALSQDAEVAGAFVRCGIVTATPSAP